MNIDVLFILAVAIYSIQAQAKSSNPNSEVLDAVKSADQIPAITKKAGDVQVNCEPDATTSGPFNGADSFENYLSGIKCSEVLSDQPEKKFYSSIKQSNDFIKKHWRPFCSERLFYDANSSIDASALSSDQSQIEVTQSKYIENEKNQDLCVKPANELRFNKDYVSPTQASRGFRPSTQEETDAILQKINGSNGIREQTKKTCCSKNEIICKNLIDQIEVRFCKTKSDPNESDECTEEGTYYALTSDHKANIARFLSDHSSAKEGKGKFPLKAGFISLSGLSNANGTPRELDGVFEHEFGHACSFIRRQIAIYNGHEETFNDWKQTLSSYDVNGKPIEGCFVSANAIGSFTHLLNMMSVSSDTINCLINVAKAGDKTKFVEPSQNCTNGCPRAHLEESFGDWMKIKLALENKRFDIVSNVCIYQRDDLHSHGEDNFQCALKTEKFKKLFKETVGCK